MSATTIQPASEPPPPLVPREWRLRLDPLLLLATLGLVACSLIALQGRHAERHPGPRRTTTSTARRSTRSSACVLMYGVSRLDYSRLRELRYPLYGFMIGSCSCVLALATATRGAKAGSRCRSSTSSRPSSARCCSWSRCRASWSTGCARWGARRPPGSCCSGCSRRCSSWPSRTSARRLVYVVGDARPAVRGRRAVAALRRARRAVRGRDRARAGGGARGSASRCSSPTRWTA